MSPNLSSGAANSGMHLLSNTAAQMPVKAGEVVGGRYQVDKIIGEGGMGYVVSATHVELGEPVALKFLRPEAMSNPELVARFAREARAACRIKSEYVARVFDVGSLADGAPFIVMEYLEGRDLGEVLHDLGRLPFKVTVEYIMQTCEALAAAHANGIIHRDVKPENLFLTRHAQGMDTVKVLDFGISKVALTGSAFSASLPLVKTMMPMGSPVYMSPEQIRAAKDVDARSDIWSLGAVLYELIGGRAAFDAPSVTQLSAIILESTPEPLHNLCHDVPPALEAVVNRCLEKDPNRRYQNVAELALALFPFAPQRSRICAERCCSILQGAGLAGPELGMPSNHPPPFESNGAPSLSIKLEAMRATDPTQQGLSYPGARKSRASRIIAGAGAAIVVVAVGMFLMRKGQVDAPPAPAAEHTQADAKPMVQTPAPAEQTAPPTVGAPSAANPEVTTKTAPASVAPARARALTPASRQKRAGAAKIGPQSPEEPDLGF